MHFRLKSQDSAATSSVPQKRPFLDAVESHFLSKQLGENGMPEYTNEGLGSDLLALNQLVRGGDPTVLSRKILAHGTPLDVAYLIVMIFSTRNARGGKGEKKLAFDIMVEVLRVMPLTGLKLLQLFPHYGYWKDLLLLMEIVKKEASIGTETKSNIFRTCKDLFAKQLRTDMVVIQEYESRLDAGEKNVPLPKISLVAKWLPRENSSLDKKIDFVSDFAMEVFNDGSINDGTSWESASKAKYRRTLTQMTAFLKLPEVLLAAHREDEINFGLVASKATLRLRKVFLNEDKKGNIRSTDPKRIRMTENFLEQTIRRGLKGAQLMPHEIVGKIRGNRITKADAVVLDAQWKSMRESVLEQINTSGGSFDTTKVVPLSDVSASMYGTPIEVAIAMGILISEITHEAFRGLVMTFESKPRWHKLDSSMTIVEKVRSLSAAPWGGSTNFRAAYELILDVAKKEKLAREDVPALIVFSDMQFDEAAGLHTYRCKSDWSTMHNTIQKRFATIGAGLGWEDTTPTPIVYWNLRNTGGHPVNKDEEGAVMLSGFSPSLLKLVMQGKFFEEVEVEVTQVDGTTTTDKIRVTPEEAMYQMLNDDLYDPVKQIVIESQEGKLAFVEGVFGVTDEGKVNATITPNEDFEKITIDSESEG